MTFLLVRLSLDRCAIFITLSGTNLEQEVQAVVLHPLILIVASTTQINQSQEGYYAYYYHFEGRKRKIRH